MQPRRFLRAAARHVSTLPRRWAVLRGGEVRVESVSLVSTAGYALAGKVYVPEGSGGGVAEGTPPRLAPTGASSGERGEDASAGGGAAPGAASTGPRPRRSPSNGDREGGRPPSAPSNTVPDPKNARFPGLVISPAIRQGLAGLEDWRSPVTPEEIARLGYVVLAYDPAGRGESWGEDDFGGPEHADDLRVAVRALRARGDVRDVAVLSLSLGLAAACAALATWPDEIDARWLLDWEGPCDREIITSGGKRMAPAMGHALEDDTYWHPREAVRHVGGLRCGYVRLQAVPDHAQPAEVRHAHRMIHAAAASATVPWFQLNDHPRGVDPARPLWHRGGTLSANRQILAKLAELRDAVPEGGRG